jgi:hypothetical protein
LTLTSLLCVESLDRLRNDVASLRVQFFKAVHDEITAESKKVMDKVVAMETKTARDVDILRQQLANQTNRCAGINCSPNESE